MAIIFGPTCAQMQIRDSRCISVIFPGISPGITTAVGGILFYKSGGVAWIIAPREAEISRTWFDRFDSVTVAKSTAPCPDWFLPDANTISDYAHRYKSFWDASGTCYWGSNEYAGHTGGSVGIMWSWPASQRYSPKPSTYCVRAFRCVTY